MNADELRQKIAACNGDYFLMYGYVRQLEEIEKPICEQCGCVVKNSNDDKLCGLCRYENAEKDNS